MKKEGIGEMSALLRKMVTVTLVLNVAALFLVPGLVGLKSEGGWLVLWDAMERMDLPKPVILLLVSWQYLFRVWREPYTAVLTLFLWTCGCCTAIVLWQARKVLKTVEEGSPFRNENAKSLKWAAVSFFVILGAALVRLIFQLGLYQRATAYNALFVPVALMAGLLCLVMAALFRQAAELKEENDLTI